MPHHIEHVVAKQHGGFNGVANFALACHRCNLHKGPNLSGIDPFTKRVETLFHPRLKKWESHFAVQGASIEGVTAAGRATAAVLAFNDSRRIELRQELLLPGELD